MTALLGPRASLVCQVLKGTKVSQESQGEKAQKGRRYGEKGTVCLCHCDEIHNLRDPSAASRYKWGEAEVPESSGAWPSH